MAAPVAEYRARLEKLRNEIHHLGMTADIAVTRETDFLSIHVQKALERLFQLASFIKGDFDNRAHDENEMSDILKGLSSECDTVLQGAKACLGALGDIHVKAEELYQEAAVLKAQVEVERGEVTEKIHGLDKQLKTVNEALQQHHEVLDRESKALQELTDKLAKAESASKGVDIGLSIAFPLLAGILALARESPSGVLGLRKAVDETRSAVQAATDTVNKTMEQLSQLETERQALSEQERSQTLALSELSALEELAKATANRISTMEADLVKAKASATEAALRAGSLSNDATLTAVFAITKAEFAKGILDILVNLIVDHRAALTARVIVDTLVSQYGGDGLPKALQERCEDIVANLNSLALPQPKDN
ncbi:hypothetical protein VTH06DRAFT_6869 [Thermothelomyces fergusii]